MRGQNETNMQNQGKVCSSVYGPQMLGKGKSYFKKSRRNKGNKKQQQIHHPQNWWCENAKTQS